MKLASLHIDRFGARKDLKLADFTNHLNVVYGPNGAGKTTIIQFIRWMIFGDRDELSRRYLDTSDGPAGGFMTVRDHHGLRTLQRRTQAGSLISQLTLPGQPASPTSAPMTLSNAEFDRFFITSFDRARSISDLVNSANLHGLQLHVDQRRAEQAQHLRDQIDQRRQELEKYRSAENHEQLLRLRAQKQQNLDALRHDLQRRQQELQELRTDIAATLDDVQSRVHRLRDVHANTQQAFEARKRQLEELKQQWIADQREMETRRQNRLAEIEQQLNHWREIRRAVRSRLDEVQSRYAPASSVADEVSDREDLAFFVQQLGVRIQDIEQDIAQSHSLSWYDHKADADHLRRLLGSATHSMRNELARLGQSLEQQQQLNELHETRQELRYLENADKELSELADALLRQKAQCEASSHSIGDPDNARTPSQVQGSSDAELPYASSSPETPYAFRSSPIAWNDVDDFRLRHLAERRESANARLQEALLECSANEQKLRQMDAEQARRNEPNIERVQRELEQLDARLRERDQCLKLERDIAALEQRWRQLTQSVGSSQTVHRASELLRRMTEGAYWKIEISQDHRCQVTGQVGSGPASAHAPSEFTYDYSQLSRGLQDQVYLAMVLAIVESLDAQGDSAPIILNDVFSNLDDDATRCLSPVLDDFARRHQMFVFTRHHHVCDAFREINARVFTLREDRPITLPQTPQTPNPSPGGRPVYDSAIAWTPPPTPHYKWVAEWQDRSPVASIRIEDAQREPLLSMGKQNYPSLGRTEETSVAGQSSAPKLTWASPLKHASLLGDEFVEYMKRLDVDTVGEFLELDPDYGAQQLAAHGITLDVIQRRQRELLMLLYVRVSSNDAQLLVACGVPDPARLARADEAVLLKRIETVLSRSPAADRFGGIERYGMDKVRQWIQAARNSDYPQLRSPKNRIRPQSIEPKVSVGRERFSSSAANDDALSAKETIRLRFYLDLEDPVVDAPSIGPKTAEKLNAADVFTVSDLLQANPNELADRMSGKRFTSETIQQWQLQAELVCSIPNLRGHDAQVLVACGVEDPVTLASLEPSNFLAKVNQFVESKDGQRAIRSAKKPDLAEVTAWIQWADSARQLRAA